MCLLTIEVGYLKHNGEPYNEDDLDVKVDAALLRNNTSERNEELRSDIWQIAYRLKSIKPEQRVIVRDNYWCSGTELSNFHEVMPPYKDEKTGIMTSTMKQLYQDEEEQ